MVTLSLSLSPGPRVFFCNKNVSIDKETNLGSKGYVSCFSIAVTKHHGQGNLEKKAFYWDSQVHGVIVHEGRVAAAGRHGSGVAYESLYLDPQE